MNYKRQVILIVILLSYCSQIISQQKDLQITTYAKADGLTEVVHSYIMKDSFGYVWTYGSNAAHRFDGVKFRNYYLGSSLDGTKENLYIHRLYCSPDNEVVMCTSMGAYILDRSTDEFVSIMDGFPSHPDQLTAEFTAAVKVGNKLYFSAFIGLYSYHLQEKTWQYFDVTPGVQHRSNHHSEKVFWCIASDKFDKDKIVLFGRNTYVRFDTKTETIVNAHDIEKQGGHKVSIQNFAQTGANTFFLATYGRGTWKYNTATNTATTLYNKSSIGYQGVDFRISHSNYLVGNEIASTSYNDSIQLIDTITGHTRSYSAITDNSFDFTSFDGIVHWGTSISGLVKTVPSLQTDYKVPTPATTRIAKALANNTGNYALVQLTGGKLNSYNLQQSKLTPLDIEVNRTAVYHDHYTDQFLVQTKDQQIEVYAGKNLQHVKSLPQEYSEQIFDLKFTKDFYIIAQYGSILIYDRQENLITQSYPLAKEYFEYKGLKALNINLINDSLVILQNQQYTISLDLKTGQLKEHSEIRNLGSIRIASYDGITFYVSLVRSGIAALSYDTKSQVFTQKAMLWEQNSYELNNATQQNDSLIWLMAKDHIRVFNMKTEAYDLNYTLPISPGSVSWHITFTKDEAVFANEQRLYKIPLERPVVKINSVNLEHANLGDEQIIRGVNATLPSSQKVLEFEWSAPCFSNHDNISFYTKLEGRDDRWEYNEQKNTKLYLGLSPGEYRFRVKAITAGGPPVEKTLFDFEIQNPWYKSWWFLTLLFCGIFLLGYFIYKSRIRSITEKNRVDKHIAQLELKALRAQLNPHFIFNSLNSIKRLIQINDNETAIEYLLLFSSMIRNVLDLSDKKAITLREELDFSTKYLKMEKMRFDKNFDFVVQVENDEILDNYSIPSMILQPHLENAIWHGIMPLRETKGKLYLDIVENEDSIIIRIEDNGIGRAASKVLSENNKGHIHKSKGQSLSIDRLKLSALAREQEISTEIIDKDPAGPNPGTIIKIKLKKSND